jgi:glutamine synthetase
MSINFQPSVNFDRRFAPDTFAQAGSFAPQGSFAQQSLSRGVENRTTGFQIVGPDAGSRRLENRRPGANTNPYATAAATIVAGMQGVLDQIEPEAVPVARQCAGPRMGFSFAATRKAQHDEFRKKVPDVELAGFFNLG